MFFGGQPSSDSTPLNFAAGPPCGDSFCRHLAAAHKAHATAVQAHVQRMCECPSSLRHTMLSR